MLTMRYIGPIRFVLINVLDGDIRRLYTQFD